MNQSIIILIMELSYIIIGAAVVILLWMLFTYNSLVTLRNRVKEAWSQIDVQLKRRSSLIPNLVETVKSQQISDLNSYLIQWFPCVNNEDGKVDFGEKTVDFASLQARVDIQTEIGKQSFLETRDTLKSLAVTGASPSISKSLFESYAVSCCKEVWGLSTIERGEVLFKAMAKDIIYYPRSAVFPACEAYFKREGSCTSCKPLG